MKFQKLEGKLPVKSKPRSLSQNRRESLLFICLVLKGFFFFNFLVVIVALDHFLKVFTEFVTILVLFLMGFWYFGHEACGILAPRPGTKPLTSAVEGQVLAAGPPWKLLESLSECALCKPSSKPDLRGDRGPQKGPVGVPRARVLASGGLPSAPLDGKRSRAGRWAHRPAPPGWLRGRLPLRADAGLGEMSPPPPSAPAESTTSRHIGFRGWARHTDWFKEANSPNNSWPGRLSSGQESQPVAGGDPARRSLAQQPSQTWAEASAGDGPPPSAPGAGLF